MPEPISLGEGSSQVQFCNSDYAISIHAYPRLYQNLQRNGRHESTCGLWSNRLLHERKLRTTYEVRKTTPAETTKNMEHRQYGKSSRRNHALHHPRSTNKGNSKKHAIPRHKYRKRGYHIRIPMDGCIRTSIYMEERRHQ